MVLQPDRAVIPLSAASAGARRRRQRDGRLAAGVA